MKSLIFAAALLLLFAACGDQEESKFEAFSAEAFAFQVDNAWEVSTSFFVKGFDVREKDGAYDIDIAFTLTLVTPAGEKKEVASEKAQASETEKPADKKLEAEFVLDSTYAAGTYKVLFSAKDNIGGKTASIEKELVVEKTESK